MQAWKDLLLKVRRHGAERQDRTGIGTLALFGQCVTFDNFNSFPAVTIKRLAFTQVAAELACFIQGFDNLEEFHSVGCRIWDANQQAAYWRPRKPGDVGRIYGVQWRGWRSVVPPQMLESGYSGIEVKVTDQLADLVRGLKAEPHSRRHVVTALNPGELDQMCLPPCHVMFQCFVVDGRLDLCVYMRSVDLFLGLPFDIASYALLQALIAKEVGLFSGYLTFMLGDAHIYLNHLDQVAQACAQEPLEPPQLVLAPAAELFTFRPEQARLDGYKSHGAIPAPINV